MNLKVRPRYGNCMIPTSTLPPSKTRRVSWWKQRFGLLGCYYSYSFKNHNGKGTSTKEMMDCEPLKRSPDPYRNPDNNHPNQAFRIAFCTTSHNRLWRLHPALLVNLFPQCPYRESVTINDEDCLARISTEHCWTEDVRKSPPLQLQLVICQHSVRLWWLVHHLLGPKKVLLKTKVSTQVYKSLRSLSAKLRAHTNDGCHTQVCHMYWGLNSYIVSP